MEKPSGSGPSLGPLHKFPNFLYNTLLACKNAAATLSIATDSPAASMEQTKHLAVPLVEFMWLVFTHMPGESYRRRLRSLLLCSRDVFLRVLINSIVCWFQTHGCKNVNSSHTEHLAAKMSTAPTWNIWLQKCQQLPYGTISHFSTWSSLWPCSRRKEPSLFAWCTSSRQCTIIQSMAADG